jgi:two-component system chemotaxis response regulator CheB
MEDLKMTKKIKAIVIGGSAGSFPIISKILESLSPQFQIPIILVMHRLKDVRYGFKEALQIKSKLKIVEPEDKESIKKGLVYLAPSNYHLNIELGNIFSLSTEPVFNNSRPSIDFTFDSISYKYKSNIVGILLSGANHDGALGMKKLKQRGGITIIQDPKTCVIDTMPQAALKETSIDLILDTEQIIEFLNDLT